jgi:hypothetical protein
VSAESEVRDALVAHAALIAVVPAARISVDAVDQGGVRPYIAFASQGYSADLGLDNTLHATATTIDIQCIGSDRAEAIEVRDLVRAALSAAGLPSDRGSAGFDPEQGLEVEVVTVDWFDV